MQHIVSLMRNTMLVLDSSFGTMGKMQLLALNLQDHTHLGMFYQKIQQESNSYYTLTPSKGWLDFMAYQLL